MTSKGGYKGNLLTLIGLLHNFEFLCTVTCMDTKINELIERI